MISEDDERLLEKHRPKLIKHIDLEGSSLLAELRSRWAITGQQEQVIKSKIGNEQVEKLLDFLLRGDANTLDKLIYALEATDSPGHSSLVHECFRSPHKPDNWDLDDSSTAAQTPELQNTLRDNLTEQLNQWKTPLDEYIQDYIDQPLTARKMTPGESNSRKEEQLDVSSITQLLVKSSPGDRIVVYGEAGMGKTTMLRQLALSWVKDTAVWGKKYTFVFLILMRLARSHSLLDIICTDLKLLPASCKKRLKESLNLDPSRILFLLDSYEELPFPTKEIERLCERGQFERSTVLVSSRPDSQLIELQSQLTHFTTVQLEDLPEEKIKEITEEKIKEITESYLQQQEDGASLISEVFSTPTFLQRPINLALFLFILPMYNSRQRKSPVTQTELFNLILQHIMLVYAKKEKQEEFTITDRSYLKNREIPLCVRAVFKVLSQKCYYALQRRSMILTTRDGEGLCQEDFLNFGLFVKGPRAGSVVLPHPLFQEHFAAQYLEGDFEAWKMMFDSIKLKSESVCPRPSLAHAVRPLENVIRFLVGLSPKIAEQVWRLFVIEKQKTPTLTGYSGTDQPNMQYELDLLKECTDEATRSNLVKAIVKAPVVAIKRTRSMDVDLLGENHESHDLLPYLTYDERITFLKAAYNCYLCGKDANLLESCDGSRFRNAHVVFDSYILAMVYLYNWSIHAERLHINTSCHIPVRMLSQNITTELIHLELDGCTLCREIPDYMLAHKEKDKALPDETSSPRQQACTPNASLRTVGMDRVRGMQHMDVSGVISSQRCTLRLRWCDAISMSTVKKAFPEVHELSLKKMKVEHDVQFPKMCRLWLANCRDVNVHLLSLMYMQLTTMCLQLCKVSFDETDTKVVCTPTANLNHTLYKLTFDTCEPCEGNGGLDLASIFKFAKQYARPKILEICGCQLLVDPINEGLIEDVPEVESVCLKWSPVFRADEKLSVEEVHCYVRRRCPSAREIKIWENQDDAYPYVAEVSGPEDSSTEDPIVDDSQERMNHTNAANDTIDQENAPGVTPDVDPQALNTSDDISEQSQAKRKCRDETASNKKPRI